MEYVLIETHFGVPEHAIRSFTRNRCGEDINSIIQELASILYPDIEFEVLFLAPEPGSYKDIAKIVGGTLATVSTLGVLLFQILEYNNSNKEYIHNEKMQSVDDTMKCLDLKKKLLDLKKEGIEFDNIPDEQINLACGNIKIKKAKNDRIITLKKDNMISDDEVILLNSNKKIIKRHKIKREDFDNYIEYIPEDEDYLRNNIEGVIEIISPVVKQSKEGKGIQWKGVYYGDNIKERGLSILDNGEHINFYMQDEDFKKKIYGHEIKFGTGDNIKTLFSLKCVLKINLVQNKYIYINNVLKINEDVAKYKGKTRKDIELKKKVENNTIMTLF